MSTTTGYPKPDAQGVIRVPHLADLPDLTLVHIIAGHEWGDPPILPVTEGWNGAAVSRARFACTCERVRSEVIDDDTGELLSRSYTGGYLLASGARVTRADARAEWIHRKHLIMARRKRKPSKRSVIA